jgi:hypothetical protein
VAPSHFVDVAASFDFGDEPNPERPWMSLHAAESVSRRVPVSILGDRVGTWTVTSPLLEAPRV